MARLTIADLEVETPDEGLEIEMADGTVFTLQDPKALSLDVVMTIESLSPMEQTKAIIAGDRWDEFTKQPEVNGYFFEALMAKYMAHFGLGTPGEGLASPR